MEEDRVYDISEFVEINKAPYDAKLVALETKLGNQSLDIWEEDVVGYSKVANLERKSLEALRKGLEKIKL